ncbi:site-specific integrase [Arthrobacter sp. zg-Y859]|uniref:Site-specific integrase n=1 Tax=Arthrobacter jinronghuae TaxID=2964609 RepID=A0ABT1NV19_9MICC|nr:tyrosine-type recombinase/integrase [Arthrobacter jinronghuae]MCQ1951577.1 site-specific integrase [Arthrobacter jinronghuae]UWX79708.1 site-specific integrase [Arthrobacter jinronghuae]
MPRTGRPVMSIGEHGNISARKLKERTDTTPEVWRAQAWVRGRDGKSKVVTAQGRTETLAKRALQAKLKQKQGGDVALNANSRVEDLAERWYATLDRAPGTMDNYRQQIDAHIKPMLGQVRLAEITTGRVEDFLTEVMKPRQVKMVRTNGRPMTVQRGGPHAAKACRVVLSLMFGMAVRHDAIDTNPVRESERPALPKTTIRALTLDEVNRLRENVAQWQDSDGHKSQDLSDKVDLFVATGLRPGELLALRWEDLDLHATPPTATVTGTVRRTSSTGLYRQPFPKSEHGLRELPLPGFAVAVLAKRKLADDPAANPLGLVFPSRRGTVVDPANFRRQWRSARGEEFDWVKPSSFRKAVATLLDRELGSLVASRQLGHSSDAITRRYYIERDRMAPDSTHILDMFAPRKDVSG